MTERVLVTGAGGFIGSHLVEALVARGCRVRALVRYNGRNDWGRLERLPQKTLRKVEVLAGDVTDPFFTDRAVAGTDTVYHLAALIAIPFSYHAPQSYVAVNIQGTLNVLQAALRHKVRRVLQTSTSEVYGTARYVPIDEAHPLQGQSPYSASKIGADHLAESFHRSFGLPVTVVRPFNTFGARQSARAVLPAIAVQVLTGRTEVEIGDTRPVRDWTYVSDIVEGFMALAASPRCVGETVNLGSGRGVTVREAAQAIARLARRPLTLKEDSRRLRPPASEVLRLVASAVKARRLAGWKPRVSFEQGLERMMADVWSHLDDYKTDLYNL